MIDKKNLATQILINCDISDAGSAGLYSICGLALRLRDLFKWENRLDPWVEKNSGEILDWIGAKEDRWEKLAERPYKSLFIDGREFDPFDVDSINRVLTPEGIMYGAGYARGLKPTFFLAQILEKKQIAGRQVFLLGEELARDMLTLPALCQEDNIVFRKESARMYFWDQLFYMKKSGVPFLEFALKKCGIEKYDPESLRKNLDFLLDRFQDSYVYHEVGELNDSDFERNEWREIIAAYPRSIVEYFARTVKDLLADLNAHGTLNRIIEERDEISLALYAAFFDGLARELFPELRIAVDRFALEGDWTIVEKAVESGYAMAKRNKDLIVALYRRGEEEKAREWVEKKIGDYLNK